MSGSKTMRVRLLNGRKSNQLLVLSSLSPPFVADPDDAVLLTPLGSDEVLVTFAPTDGRLHLEELQLRSRDGVCDLTVSLRGLGTGALRSDPPEVELVLSRGETRTREFRIENTRRVPLTLGFAVPPPVTVSLPDGDQIGALGSLRVQVTATLEQWQRNDVIMLVSSELDKLQIPIKLLPSSPLLEVTPLGPIEVPVVGMDLSSMPRGFTERILKVRNAGTSGDPSAPKLSVLGIVPIDVTFPVDEVAVRIPAFNLLAENESTELAVRFTPQMTGPRSFEIQLSTTAGGFVVPFSTRAAVLPPCGMQVSPLDLLTLHEVPDGGVEGTVIFDNVGNTVCTVDGVRLSSSTPGFTIAGSANEQFTVMPKTQQQLTIAGPRQPDAGQVGWFGYQVFQENSDVRTIALEVP